MQLILLISKSFLRPTLHAIVDDEDFELTNRYNWSYLKISGKIYARAMVNGRNMFMHSFIMGVFNGVRIDHIDGDGLNNQKSNLRKATASQNLANRTKQKNNTSGFKGVTWDKNRKQWVAQISCKGVHVFIGRFVNVHDAAKAYNAKALEFFGEFAKLNTLV